MYVTKDINFLDIPAGMFPTLAYQFASPGVVNNNALARDLDKEYYKDKDFELLKNLYNFRFATEEQLCKLLKIEDVPAFKARLNQLLSRRVINRFSLSKEHSKGINTESDALIVYCLDFTGVELLARRYQRNSIVNYSVSANIQDSSMIGKKLFIVDFYIRLLEAIPKENIELFDPTPEYPINKIYEGGRASTFRFCPSFTLGVKKDGATKFYTCEIFTSEELGQTLVEELRLLDEFLPKTKAFMPTDDEEARKAIPTLLLFTANDEDMLTVTKAIIANAPSVKTYRLSSQNRVKEGLGSNGAFFKFEENTLKPVTMSVFNQK